MIQPEEIKNLAVHHFDPVRSIRRHIHMYPELSFQEYETSSYIAGKLDELGIPFQKMAGTGLVGLLKGRNPGSKVIALRADIDALPIQEVNKVEYKSKNEGIMHACGHDVHTSSLLGVVHILNDLKDQFEGTIKLIFQPGEEKLPGGASILISEGVLENPAPEVILGQHVMPELKAGTVGFRPGKFMASADEIYITVKGRGGHAAMPYNVVDPVVISAHMITALQQIVSRNAHPNTPTVLSFGYIEGRGATNIIPGEVIIKGTFRTFDEKWRDEAHERIRQIATGVVKSMGGTCDIRIEKGYPFLENDHDFTRRAKKAAKDYLGEEKVIDLDLRATAEDFAYYSQHMPACFYRLGISNREGGIDSGLHTPTFDIDEEALKTGMGLMAYLALLELESKE